MGRSWVARTMARWDCYAERVAQNKWTNTEPGETRAWYFCTQATFPPLHPSYLMETLSMKACRSEQPDQT